MPGKNTAVARCRRQPGALATAGRRFTSCIMPNPVCQVSRASILFGLLPPAHGVCDNDMTRVLSFGRTVIRQR
ncbi:MAG: hypothetical protein CMQ61_12390 [Gammaproteobacteria bacterium]|nr:hypothetical protein [Gammaproteobacteria bacterium]